MRNSTEQPDQQQQQQQHLLQLQQALLHSQQQITNNVTSITSQQQQQTYEQTLQPLLQIEKNVTTYNNQSTITPTSPVQQQQHLQYQTAYIRQQSATFLQQSNLQAFLNCQLNHFRQQQVQSTVQLQPPTHLYYKQLEKQQQQFQPTTNNNNNNNSNNNKTIATHLTSGALIKTTAATSFETFNNMSSTTMSTRNFLINSYNHNQYAQQTNQCFMLPNAAGNIFQPHNYNNNQFQAYQQNVQQQEQQKQQQMQYQRMQQQMKQKQEQEQSHQLLMSDEMQQQLKQKHEQTHQQLLNAEEMQQQAIQFSLQQQQCNRNIYAKEQQLLHITDNCSDVATVVTNVDKNLNDIKSNDETKLTNATTPTSDKFIMDANEIEKFLANELFTQQLLSVDGIQSGVPTLTTSTLTPTTLRSIEETFVELTSEPLNAPYQAGFKPPPILGSTGLFQGSSTDTTATTFNDSNLSNYNEFSESEESFNSFDPNQINEENSVATTDTSSAATDSASFQNGLNDNNAHATSTASTSSTNAFTEANVAIVAEAERMLHNSHMNRMPNHNNNNNTSNSATRNHSSGPMRRNQGGRRPNKQSNMTPEEEEKRRVRRERNKLAAARCRKRRVDQTNELLIEVEALEKKRSDFQKNIEDLSDEKKNLERILEMHRPACRKSNVLNNVTAATLNGLINNSNDSNSTITGLDTTLASTGRCDSPLDLKPIFIKNEPHDTFDSNSSLDQDDGATSPKRTLLSANNPMVSPLPPFRTSLISSPTLNTPVVSMAPTNFGSLTILPPNSKPRPNSLNVAMKAPLDINGVAIQTPSTGMLNYDSLMDGGTGLTPVGAVPLVPISLQNGFRQAHELSTPTSETTLTNLVSY